MATYGRARRLVESIEAVAGASARAEITDGLKEPTSGTSPKRRGQWAREVVERMDGQLDPEQCREIRERCAYTPAKKHVAAARRTWRATGNLPDYVRATNEAGWHGPGLSLGADTLVVPIATDRCWCGLINGIDWHEEPVSKTYCYCTVAHIRSFFGDVFERPVEVEAVHTLVSGGPGCTFRVRMLSEQGGEQ